MKEGDIIQFTTRDFDVGMLVNANLKIGAILTGKITFCKPDRNLMEINSGTHGSFWITKAEATMASDEDALLWKLENL
jgi:hypothetical protein